jgi:DNA-binding NarL/FixJ family response regulator
MDAISPASTHLPILNGQAETFRLLTRQQMAIMNHLACGLSNKEIAFALGLSPSTVKTHVLAIYQRTSFRNRIELAVNWLIFTGAITASPDLRAVNS